MECRRSDAGRRAVRRRLKCAALLVASVAMSVAYACGSSDDAGLGPRLDAGAADATIDSRGSGGAPSSSCDNSLDCVDPAQCGSSHGYYEVPGRTGTKLVLCPTSCNGYLASQPPTIRVRRSCS